MRTIKRIIKSLIQSRPKVSHLNSKLDLIE